MNNQSIHQLRNLRNLLKSNRPSQAAQQLILNLNHHHHQQQQEYRDWFLWKSTNLFRSFNHQELAFKAFNLLSIHPPRPSSSINSLIPAIQLCSDLVWKHLSKPQDDQNYHHQLAQSLTLLIHQSHPSSSTRVLQVILSNLLKLADLDSIVSTLSDFYPNYIHQLGLYLYPNSSSLPSIPIILIKNENEIPSARLIKFLVSGYMLCKDVRRSYLVVKFHRSLISPQTTSIYDPTLEITLLHRLSRSTVRSDLEIKMVKKLLGYLGSQPIDLDTYVLDGLLEVRYRSRSIWRFQRSQLATFEVIRCVLESHLRIFLIHWGRRSSSSLSNDMSEDSPKVYSLVPAPQSMPSWRYRPSAKSFTILLLALRDHLRYQTRPIISSLLDRAPQQGDGEKQRAKKRRPSPGAHRSVLAQMLAFDDFNHAACHLPSPASHQSPEAEKTRYRLPHQFRLLTLKNVKLLVESLLLGRDYPSVMILLTRLVGHEYAGSDEEERELVEVFGGLVEAEVERLSSARSPSLMVEYRQAIPPSDALPDRLQRVEVGLRICFHLEFNLPFFLPTFCKLSSSDDRRELDRKSPSWQSETEHVLHRIQLESAKLASFHHRHQPPLSFSPNTLRFLRLTSWKDQLDLLSWGLG